MDIVELKSREFAAEKILEVISIPTLESLKGDSFDDEKYENDYRKIFSSILVGIHQSYTNFKSNNQNSEISLESLWITEKVENQVFNAKIRFFFIVRSIGRNKNEAINSVERIYELIKSNLNNNKYRVNDVEIKDLNMIWSNVSKESIRTIGKNERIDSLQNQMLPYCYTFDIFDGETKDLSSLVNTLINYPNCAVSLQLIPTTFNNNEEEAITKYSQMLDSLAKGIMLPGAGNVSYTSAEYSAQRYKYYLLNKKGSLFEYSMMVYGTNEECEAISSSYFSYANHADGSQAFLKNTKISEKNIGIEKNHIILPWVVREYIQNNDRNKNIWSTTTFADLYRMPFIVSAEEASLYFRLPIGTSKIGAGLPIDEVGKKSKTYSDDIVNAGDIRIGELKSSTNSDYIGINLNDLTKHMFVTGTPGSGKTTFSVSLLDRLWKEHHIPFLVIEPAKNEYRALIQSIPELQVFTPGKNFISPFIYNPFVPPKNVKLETYKSTLKTAFAAGVSMTTPLDKIFEESINNCYSDFRWLDSYTIDNKGKIFNISDFIKCFQETFNEIGYTGDAKNIGRAGVVRLKSFVNLFDNYFSIPIEDLLCKPTVIELAAIENSEQKALIISLLLLSILSYVNSNYTGDGKLKNVILLEEAHVLLDAESNAGIGEANPSLIAKNLVKRMLAEIRSYGIGIVIADQSPRKVSLDVVALTDIKLVFRLVEGTDKQIMADSMNMNELHLGRLTKLKPGESFIFFNKLDEPEEIVTPNYRLDKNIDITISDKSIADLSTYWKDKKEMIKPYPECNIIENCRKGCNYDTRLLGKEIARRIFNKNLSKEETNYDNLKEVFAKISNLVKSELNDEEFTDTLLKCTKCHLWRKIKYETKLQINEELIEKSLRK